jgi:hypothetical protein
MELESVFISNRYKQGAFYLNEVRERRAIPCNGSLQGLDLIVEVCLSSGGPHAEQKSGLCVD